MLILDCVPVKFIPPEKELHKMNQEKKNLVCSIVVSCIYPFTVSKEMHSGFVTKKR